MTLLEKQISNILQLKNPLYKDEALKKLRLTYMIVNGFPRNILEFLWDYNSVIVEEGKGTTQISVETIEIFMPKSGIYMDELGSCYFLEKKPQKQWSLSFRKDQYCILQLSNKETNNILHVLMSRVRDIVVLPNRDIYYHRHKIGFVDTSEHIICTNNLYLQELIDWSKYES